MDTDRWELIVRAVDAVDALPPRSVAAEALRLAASALTPEDWLLVQELLVGRMDLGRPGR